MALYGGFQGFGGMPKSRLPQQATPTFQPPTALPVSPQIKATPTFEPRRASPMFFPRTPSRIGPQLGATPVSPQLEAEPIQSRLGMEPTPIAPREATPITPTALQEATPVQPPTEPKYPFTGVEPGSPLNLNRVRFPAYGWARFKTPMFDMALKGNASPGVTKIEWLRQTYGDDYAWKIIEAGARNPQKWLKQFEEPLAEEPIREVQSRIPGWGG